MSEVLAETPTTDTPTSETTAPAPNTPEARTDDGTIKNQSTSLSSEPTTKSDDKPADKPADGAPETYGDFKAPEGYTLTKELVDEVTPIFKELNLSQDQAQKLVDFYSKNQSASAEAGQAAYNAMREEWRGEVLKDTNLATGNELKPEVRQAIGRTIDALGSGLTGKFRQIMDLTGAGDNHAFVKAMFEFSKFVTEGRPVSGAGPSSAGQTSPNARPPSIASAMFPKLK